MAQQRRTQKARNSRTRTNDAATQPHLRSGLKQTPRIAASAAGARSRWESNQEALGRGSSVSAPFADRRSAPQRAKTPRELEREQLKQDNVRLFVFGQRLSFDYGVMVCTIVLTVIGLLMVLSASSYSEGINGDSLGEFKQQVFGAVVGFGALLLVMNLDYRILRQKWIVMTGVIVTIALLAMVMFLPKIVSGPPIWSPYVNSAHRWLRIGTRNQYLSIQPSEIAKVTMVLFLAWYMDLKHNRMNDLIRTVFPMLAVAGVYALLVVFQPNLSTTGAILMVVLTMFYIGGVKWWVNCSLIVLGIAAITFLLIFVYDETRLVRVTNFIDPWADAKGDGWQLIQSYFALANGGWFGTGIGMSRQKHLFLPYSSSDFIFAIVGEELGFVSAALILAGFFLLVFFGVRVAVNAYDRFGCYLASGITAMLGIQVIINIMVVTGLMPTTGLPLPFFTAGGTTLMIFLSSMGLLLSVSRRQNPLARRPKRASR